MDPIPIDTPEISGVLAESENWKRSNFLFANERLFFAKLFFVSGSDASMPRIKPLNNSFEKEIVMYAHYKKLVYFSTECLYAPNAYRGYVRLVL